MPAQSSKQQHFMQLAMYYKKHGSMPEGAGKATSAIKKAASSMSMAQLREYAVTKKKKD